MREAVRKSLSSKPLEFGSKELMLEYVKKLVKKKFNYDVGNLLDKSIVLRNMKAQAKLSAFLT